MPNDTLPDAVVEEIARALCRNDCGSDPDELLGSIVIDDRKYVWELYGDDARSLTPIIARLIAEAREWQPIETAPRDGTVVDLWFEGERWADCYWSGAAKRGKWRSGYDGDEGVLCGADEPTAWMPLPPPPKGSSDD